MCTWPGVRQTPMQQHGRQPQMQPGQQTLTAPSIHRPGEHPSTYLSGGRKKTEGTDSMETTVSTSLLHPIFAPTCTKQKVQE